MNATVLKASLSASLSKSAFRRPSSSPTSARTSPVWRVNRPRFVVRAIRTETGEDAVARRRRETEQVVDRVITIGSVSDLNAEIAKADGKLVVIEVINSDHCQVDAQHDTEKGSCAGIAHSFQRTARDCPSAVFLEAVCSDDDLSLAQELGVEVFPTIQFVRDNKMLWQHKGLTNLDIDLAEGVLFYGDAGGDGMHPSDYITEITSKADLDKWKSSLDKTVLGVLDVSVNGAAACVHIYPTVVVLARQFKGYASFARLIADTNEETKQIAKDLNIIAVPTFEFYREGAVVGQHVGTSRSDLICAILSKQSELGLTPPPPEQARSERHMAAVAAQRVGPSPSRWNNLR
jgi:hypothetical protein